MPGSYGSRGGRGESATGSEQGTEPDGLLEDDAAELMFAVMPEPSPVPPERRVKLAGERMKEFSREGITSFFVPGSSAGSVRTFQSLRDAGGLTARAHFALSSSVGELKSPGGLYDRVERERTALDAFAHARRENPKIRAHQTIAHAEVVDPADYRRFGKLDDEDPERHLAARVVRGEHPRAEQVGGPGRLSGPSAHPAV
ncbi:MAG: hypothetical protein GEV11_02855 [Streptosporangiales bacterium]|nr:hypothetical protein [Streptosporangiales bacterium]